MRFRIALLLLVVLCLPVWAKAQSTGGGAKSASTIPSIIAQTAELSTIGPDGTFYLARTRSFARTDTTATSILPQQSVVRAIGVHDTRDPRWQAIVDGFPAGIDVGERNVYVATISLPIMTMGGPSAGGNTSIPVIGAARMYLLNPATGAVNRTVDLAGGAIRSVEVKKVQNAEYVYVVSMSPVTILIYPPPPPSPILEIFDADGTRIKRVSLGAE